jgi:membrane-bound lytic murein transglycosylase D
MSLLIRQEDGSEDDITLLLSPDYLRQFDIPIVFNDAVQYFVKHFTVEKRRIFVNWLRRSKRYVPMIREILRDHKLPEDLIYLAMIESGFNPKAYSPMKASGPWQFIYATGGRYGLRVNHWIDERRDPEKSTVAAALYLKDLFNQFGSWYLAAAGYNAGEKRIERAIEKHETGDFWELSKYNALPRETREYIPRLIAAAIIAKDPEKFGMTNINYDRPICFLNEKVPGGTSLAAIAAAASADVVTIRSLNPEILTGITPPDMEYAVKLPETVNREAFRANLQTALNKEKKIESIVAYTFKKRDSLTRITKRYNVSVSDLMLVNNCDQELKVKPGVTVYIPNFSPRQGGVEVVLEEPASKSSAPSSARAEEMRAGRKAVKPAQSDKKTASRIAKGNSGYHIVKKGESLTGISEKYGIDLATLKAINRIRKDHISPNMRLELVSHARTSAKPKQVYHVVKKGESLSSIAERYGADIESVKKTNRLKQGKIRVGLKLKIPAPRSSVTDRAAPPAG